jgi:hypothetical protein
MRGQRDLLHYASGRMLVASLFLLPLGCGSSSGTISGKVFYNGRVVPGGTIMFVAEGNGGTVTTTIEEDGSYRAVKVPPGLAKIALRPHQPPPIRKMADKSAFLPGNDPSKTAKQSEATKPREYLWIPEQYGDPEKSGLTLQVQGGAQQFDIKLEGPSGRSSAKTRFQN